MVDCLLFFQFCQFLLNKFWGFVVRCIYIYSWYIFLLKLHIPLQKVLFMSRHWALWSFEWCFHWKFHLNAQVLFMIFNANNLLCCFLNQSFKDLCTAAFETCSCKVVPPGRTTKSVLNIFVLFLYWFCQMISVSIPNQLAEVISGLFVFLK